MTCLDRFGQWSQLPYNSCLLGFAHEVFELIHIALEGANELHHSFGLELLVFFLERRYYLLLDARRQKS